MNNKIIDGQKLTKNEKDQLVGGFELCSADFNTHFFSDNGNCKGGGWCDDNTNCNRCANCDQHAPIKQEERKIEEP